MSSYAAPRCRHIKVNGTQCGSPALRDQNFCFYHHKERPWPVECYSDGEYATGDVILPYFEDAHSIQAVVRRVMQMLMQKRIERKTASLLLYALQIASSNLKRMDLEKPQPEQVVVDIDTESKMPIAALVVDERVSESSARGISVSDSSASDSSDNSLPTVERREQVLPPGTIQACEESELVSAIDSASHPSRKGREGWSIRTRSARGRERPLHTTFAGAKTYCSGVTLPSQVLMAVTALRTTASAKEQK